MTESLKLYDSYEEYLDAHLVDEDLYYLKDIESARLILMLGYRSGVKVYGKEDFYKERMLEIRSEELNNSKRSSVKSKSISSKGRSSVLSGFNEDGPDNILMEIERHDSLISGLSSSISRPGTAPPPNKDDHLEKALYDAIFWRKESIANKDILSLVFVMMINCKNQEIVGFLDLQSRLSEVVSMLEVGPDWLEPTKYDLTFTNVKTQKCLINNTEVFKIVPESPSYTEFHIPDMNINIVPYPEKAELKGKNAPYYKIDQEEIESERYKKIIFYDIEKKATLPQTVTLLEKSAKSIKFAFNAFKF